jgi:hypothetical protein
MVIINFSHPLTDAQKRAIEKLTGTAVERVVEVPSQFDEEHLFSDQARNLVDVTGLSGSDWQTLPLIVNLPSHSTIAALVLAEIHGRAGYFPAALRMRPISGAPARQFEIAEILPLQAVRDQARTRRT